MLCTHDTLSGGKLVLLSGRRRGHCVVLPAVITLALALAGLLLHAFPRFRRLRHVDLVGVSASRRHLGDRHVPDGLALVGTGRRRAQWVAVVQERDALLGAQASQLQACQRITARTRV